MQNQSQPAAVPAQSAELAEILQLRIELLKVQNELLNAQNENLSLKNRTLAVYEENQMYKASPELAQKMAEMQLHLKMAAQFIASKAFNPKLSPEQAYVIIKAGSEMGLKEVEALQSLYCANGAIKYYGDKMVGRITGPGYKVEYLNETAKQVTVRVTKDGFEAIETVSTDDPIIQKSNAHKFAPRQKLRFHAVRMIASFHLPHLFGSTADEFTSDFQEEIEQVQKGIDLDAIETRKERARILDHINKAKTLEQLEMVANVVGEYELVTEYNNKIETINRD